MRDRRSRQLTHDERRLAPRARVHVALAPARDSALPFGVAGEERRAVLNRDCVRAVAESDVLEDEGAGHAPRALLGGAQEIRGVRRARVDDCLSANAL